jgi:hypothetical protein
MNRFLSIVERILVVALVVLALTYSGDYVWLRYKMRKPTANDPFEVMTIQRFYQIPEKGGHDENGRVEFTLADPQTETCVHSIFPHAGDSPCWYLNWLSKQPISMTIFLAWPSALTGASPGIRDRH